MADTKAQKIAHLNDRFRKHHLGRGRLMVTQGINEKGPEFVLRVLGLIAAFDDFTPDNDPHKEHDFGSVEVDSEKIFWKFDYYDPTLKWGSQDPSDENQTCRVLTIMYSHEYLSHLIVLLTEHTPPGFIWRGFSNDRQNPFRVPLQLQRLYRSQECIVSQDLARRHQRYSIFRIRTNIPALSKASLNSNIF